MYRRTHSHKVMAMLLVLTISSMMAACGDESEDDSIESTDSGGGLGAGLVCFVYLLVSGDDECLSYIGTSSSGGSGGSGSGSTGGSGGGNRITFMSFDEYEPNDDLPTANPVRFPRTTDRDGFIVDGAVHDVSDQSDVFTFARPYQRIYAFRLCSDGQRYCDHRAEIDSLTTYFDIIDDSGRIVASTQANDSNFLRIELTGGVSHFVRVVAGDTMATQVRYHLVVHEENY